jgi:pimeloyl-ACP methyl ester carboxylesterase
MHSKRRLSCALATAAFAIGVGSATPAFAERIQNVVLVHGYFADGSGWQDVTKILIRDGFKVLVVQEPETSLADDVKATNRVIDAQNGPVVLVGHSYGGVVITEAGNNDKVKGLVYVAAFAPDTGESAMDLAKKTPSASTAIKATPDGFLYLDPAHYRADFAADVPATKANFMAISQVMPNAQSFGTPITNAAWKTKPSWAVVSTNDRMISPDLERFMTKRANSTTIQIHASHAVYLSHPTEVAKLIERAAEKAGM